MPDSMADVLLIKIQNLRIWCLQAMDVLFLQGEHESGEYGL